MDAKWISLALVLLAQLGGVVWWASDLSGSVNHNNYQIKMMAKDVEKNSIFVRDWPAGRYGSGSLPDDVRQNLRIESLEKQMEKVVTKLWNGN